MARGFDGLQMNTYSRISPAVKFLIIANVAIFLLQNFILPNFRLQGETAEAWFSVYATLMPAQSDFFYPYWQLITYQFLHGGLGHIFFNMLALWMFGVEIEQLWGSWRFLVYYLLCGIAGGLAHLAIGGSSPVVGASGSIMGVLVAFGMTYPDRPIVMFPFFIPIPAKYFVMIYAAIDLFSGIYATSSGVAHFAHLGGAVMGFLLVRFGVRIGFFSLVDKLTDKVSFNQINTPRSPRTYERNAHYRETPLQPKVEYNPKLSHIGSFPFRGELITEETVNRILEKIVNTGRTSLSEHEEAILHEVSRRMQG
ncbi:MAG: rhomboid family intramembrane serine protease [Candidatus Kapabacteria bacterium]|nr:rhomboid family intramembrane serine protease [Candidatus Kapabacteria bacterium]